MKRIFSILVVLFLVVIVLANFAGLVSVLGKVLFLNGPAFPHNHTFDNWEVITPPTHLTEGKEIGHCRCGETHIQAIDKIATHTFGEWTLTTPATHTVEGVESRSCECGEIETKPIAKIPGHSFGEWAVTTPATHIAEGVESRFCECGEAETKPIAKITDHSFGNWTVTTPATHLAEGEETRRCECGEIETKPIAKTTDHSFGNWTVTRPAVHTAEGVETGYCECGATSERPIAKTTEHTFVDWEITIPATHITEGVETGYCECGEASQRPVQKTPEHTFANWRVTTLATHMAEGVETGYCECGETQTRPIDKAPEHLFTNWRVVTPATHMTEGEEIGYCECGETKTQSIVKTAEHTFAGWEITTSPTHMTEGVETGYCECGATDERTVDKITQHTFAGWEVTTLPTHLTEGVETGYCECGETDERPVAKTTEHNFVNWRVTTSSTHMTEGVETGYCECGETDERPVEKTPEHTFVGWEVTTLPTHLTEGVETGYCECGETDEKPVAKTTKHTFVGWEVTTSPTHMTTGIETGYCECGETAERDVAKTTEHNFVNWKVTQASTHTEEGVETGYCECGETSQRPVQKTPEHTFVDWAITKAATHMQEGVETGYCECGATSERPIAKIAEHTFVDWAETKAATHMQEGVETGYCECGETETRAIEKIAKHTFVDWAITTAATHMQEGVETGYCECGETETRAIEKIAKHTYGEWKVTTAATHLAEGIETRVCECGASQTQTIEKIAAHTFGEWKVTTPATCTKTGEKIRECECGKVETEEIAIIDHNQNGSVLHKDATCTETGVVGGNYCTDCNYGREAAEKVIQKIPHNQNGSVLHKDATCTETGVVGGTYCTDCGYNEEEVNEIIEKLPHNTKGNIAHLDATCTETGLAGGTYCTACGEGKEQAEAVIPTTEHNQDGYIEPIIENCTEDGRVGGKYCSVCNYGRAAAEAVIPAFGHNQNGSVLHKDATCTATGTVGGTYCTTCGYNQKAVEATIPMLPHNTKGNIAKLDPTCLETGVVGGTYCTACGEGKAEAEEVISAKGHSYDNIDPIAATCTTTGKVGGQYCTVCNDGKSAAETVIPALGHSYGNWEVTTPATHLAAGEQTRSCECGEKQTQTIDKIVEHSFGDWEVTKAATHLTTGVKTRSCGCGATETQAIDKTPEHTYSDWVEITAATCTKAGEKTRECECGKVETEEIAILDHNQDGNITHVEATCTEPGVVGGNFCTACGYGKAAAQATISANGHTWIDATCTAPKTCSVCTITAGEPIAHQIGNTGICGGCGQNFKRTITFQNGNTGNATMPASISGIIGEDIPLLTTPKLSNYNFGGWYTDKACTTPFTATTFSEDMTLYAKWTAITGNPITILSLNADNSGSLGDTAKVKKAVTDAGNPDIVCLQYVGNNWVVQPSGYNYNITNYTSPNQSERKNGYLIFFKTATFERVDYILDDQNHYCYMILKRKSDGALLAVINAYFNNSPSVAEETRNNQLNELWGGINEIRGNYGLIPMIITGSINATPTDSNVYQDLTGNSAFFDTSRVTKSGTPENTYVPNGGSIRDYILVSNHMQYAVESYKVDVNGHNYNTLIAKVVLTKVACAHKLTKVAGVDATCTETGSMVTYTCSSCDKLFADAHGAVEINQADRVIPALEHTYGEGVVKAPTCETNGYTSYTCSVCGYVHTDSEIPATGHAWTNNCDTECNTCGTTREVKHDYEWVIDTAPTFVARGVKHEECTICHARRNENTPINKLTCTHSLSRTEAVPATCTSAGNKEYYTCSICNKVYANAEGTLETTVADCAIAALGHAINNEGTCSICGGNFVRTIKFANADGVAAISGIVGERINLPTPKKANNNFAGWYTDSACTTLFNETTFSENLTLYANWVPNTSDQISILSFYANSSRSTNNNTFIPQAILQASKPSIICLQNAGDTWLSIGLSGYLDGYAASPQNSSAPLVNDGDSNGCNLIFYRKDTFTAVSGSDGRVTIGNGTHYATYIVLQHKEGTRIAVINAWFDNSTDEATRNAQLQDLLAKINEIWSNEGYGSMPMVITSSFGDDTTPNDSHIYQGLIGNNLFVDASTAAKSAMGAADRGDDVFVSHHLQYAVESYEILTHRNTSYPILIKVALPQATCAHKLEKVEATDATCTTIGNKTYYICESCSKVFIDENATIETTLQECVIPALGHNNDGRIAHLDATCTETGVVGGTYCTACNNGKADAEEIIPEIGHNQDGTIDHVDATCAEEGVVGGTYCTDCEYNKAAAEEPIEKLPHNEDGNVTHKDATCTETGVVGGTYCTACGNGRDAAQAIIPATGHNEEGNINHVDETCAEEGVVGGTYCTACEYNKAAAEEPIEKLPHSNNGIVTHKDATCTEPGVVGGIYCTVCNNGKAEAEEVIPAIGHNERGIIARVDATCTENGVVGGTYCTVCKYNKDVAEAVIPATGHNQDGNVDHVNATCTETGIVGGTFCTVCKYGKSAAEAIIEKVPHNKNGNIAHVDATCTEEGIVGGRYCTVCEYNKEAAEATIEKLSHNERGVITHVDATCTEEGIVGGRYCTVCKYNKEAAEATIEKLSHNYEWKVDIDPTFDTEGVKHEECTVCQNKRNINTPVDKLSCAHDLSKTEAVAATCLTAGNKEYYTCSICGEVYLNAEGTLKTTAEDCIIAALGHTFGEWIVTTPTTHTAEGEETAYCACGETKTRTIDKIAKHTFGDWEVTTPATHTTEGVETAYCACGETKTQVIDKIVEHAFGEWETTTPATHMAEGEQTRSCACGATQTQEIDKIAEHSFVNWNVITPATHTSKGIETASCECGASQTRAIDKIAEHSFGEWKVTSPATHTVEGVQTRYCECGETETEMIDKIAEHSFDEWRVTLPASHMAEGVKTRYCECGETQTQAIDKIEEHTFGEWVETTPATCTTAGESARYCECGEFEKEPIAIIPHNKNGNIPHRDATCTNSGVVGGAFCTACNNGKAAAEAVIPAVGHKWVDATCTAPKTCSVCKATQGSILEHQIGNTGICSGCGQSFIKTVRFLSGNINTGTQLANPVSGLPGEKIPFPAPQMSNYKINGWYLDAACTKPFKETTFSENLTLYAKWVSNPAEQITVLNYHGNGSGWTNDDGPTKKAIAEAGYPDVLSFHKMGSGWKTLGIADYTASSQNAKTERFITYYKTNKFTEIDSGYTTYYSYTVLKRTSDETLFTILNVLFESKTEEEKLAILQNALNDIWNKNGFMPTIIVGNFGSSTTTDSAAYKGLIANSQFVDTSKVANSIIGASNTNSGHYAFASYHVQSCVAGYKVLTEQNGKDPVLVTVSLPKSCALIKIEGIAATCLTMGNEEYYYCSVCGKIYLDAMGTREVTAADCMIPALGHNWADATCTDPKTCTNCGLTEGVALDHVWANACDTACDNDCGTTRTVEHDYEWIIDTAPTVTAEGVKHEECTVCHVRRNENTPVDKLACTHALVKTAAIAATCTTTGNKEYYTCSICKKVYADAEGILETTVENCKTAVLDHTWAKATCNAPKTCSACGATDGNALGHNWTDATCTAPKTCSVCGATQGEPIAHNINEASICTICGNYFLRKINFKGGKLSSGTYAYDNTQIAASVYGLVGEKFSYPEITLQLKGYNFDGWCTDYACTKRYTGTTFSEDLTLYAKWVSNANQIVTFMSFNVKVHGWESSRTDQVIGTIRDNNPDVFGVQEADSLWMTSLKSEFKNDYTIVGTGRDSGSGEHCAVFFRTSMFNLIESGTKWLSNNPNTAGSYTSYTEGGTTYKSNYSRIMTYVVLQRKSDGAKFLYVNTHLDNNGDNSHDIAEKIRETEVNIIMNIIRDITSRVGNVPVIVGGDFNIIPENRSAYNAMTGTYGYLDSSRNAKEGGPSTTFTEMEDENSGIILDYLFVSSHLKNMVETYYVCPAKRDGKWVSDHNAIVAKVAIPKTN